MADGQPPPPDRVEPPVKPEDNPAGQDAAKPEGNALPEGTAAPATPGTVKLKTTFSGFGTPLTLPDVKPGAASIVPAKDAVAEAKPEPVKTGDAKTEDVKSEAAPEKKKPLKVKLFEKGVDAAGFGDILKAWRSPDNRLRNVLKSVGSKAADMVAGRIVSMTFRLIAVTWVAGIIGGVSTFGGLALLALATGAASGIYSYGKDYLHDRFYGPKEKRKDTKFIDRQRLRSAGISFAAGTFNGALGAWLAKTGILQHLFGWAKDFVTSGGGLLSQKFNDASAAVFETALKTPDVGAAFTAAAMPAAVPAPAMPAPTITAPVIDQAFRPQAIPRAVLPHPGFRRY